MALCLSLSLLGVFSVPIGASTGPGWVSLTLDHFGRATYRTNDLLVGTPPTIGSPVLDIGSSLMSINSNKCLFCPGSNLFDASLSSTYQTNNQPLSNSSGFTAGLGGVVANDTFSFGGILTSQNNLFALIDQMTLSYLPHLTDGRFGLWVDLTNETARQDHILTRLYSSGQLLNPVVGLRMGSTNETSRITIGALDPNDFDGTINWVEAETPDSSWLSSAGIKVDGFRGFNGSLLPFSGPIISYLHSLTTALALPDASIYMSQVGYRGPVDVSRDPTGADGYAYKCNETGGAYVHLSVDINGVNYQVDSPEDLILHFGDNACVVWVTDKSIGLGNASVGGMLGVPFLRSVYLAYRFPTPECPKAFYGFAFQKGANRTSSMLAQQPRSTPTQSSQCLFLTIPTSTPSVSVPPLSTDKGLSDGTYSVWGRPGQEQVRLKDIEHLSAGLVED